MKSAFRIFGRATTRSIKVPFIVRQDNLSDLIFGKWDLVQASDFGDYSLDHSCLIEPSSVLKNDADYLVSHAGFRLVY